MTSIERRDHERNVGGRDAAASIHRARAEAELAAPWLANNDEPRGGSRGG